MQALLHRQYMNPPAAPPTPNMAIWEKSREKQGWTWPGQGAPQGADLFQLLLGEIQVRNVSVGATRFAVQGHHAHVAVADAQELGGGGGG